MSTNRIPTAKDLIEQINKFGNIHVECNQDRSEDLLKQVLTLYSQSPAGYVIHSDKGYERDKIKNYINFYRKLHNCKASLDEILQRFDLLSIRNKRLAYLGEGERMLVQIARVSMQKTGLFFLEEPLLNLSASGREKVLSWIEECSENGIHFITTNSSLRFALLMPGCSFYLEQDNYCQVEQEEEEDSLVEDELQLLKIPAKSGNSTLLFEPKDIDFVESLNKCNYISVRGTLFQVSYTMDQMEELLHKSGFFRCHRSYIVNMQKVEQIERLTKNSFSLLLNDKDQNQIPLSKGRLEEMKATFGW